MIDILNSYLVQYKSISIPGLGTLYLNRQPASLDAGTNVFMPPEFTCRFDKFHDTPTKEFFHFVASRKGVQECEAIRLYNEFASALRSGIKMKDQAEWKEAGIFKTSPAGEIVFEPLAKQFPLFLPLEAEEISRSLHVPDEALTQQEQSGATEIVAEDASLPAEEDAVVHAAKPAWWFYMLVLIAVAIFVLWIHFYNKGLT